MKRLLYILSLVLIALSCTDELTEVKPILDSNKVTVDLSVSIPEAHPATKAFGDNPTVNNLYLAVFDESGFLVEYVKADPLAQATANTTRYNYSVKLTLSETTRIIHFIANAPETIRFGREEEVITSLYTSGTNDAYWYRKEIAKIEARDPAAEILTPAETTIAALRDIPLIRNFAKVVVQTADNRAFKLISYAVFNTPKQGSVAAYNRTTGLFVEDYPGKSAATLIGEGYDAFVPGSAELNNVISTEAFTNSASYVYERETPISNPAYVLVYGTYNNNDVYYKIDLRDENGKYFPLLRNFQYTVTINSVTRNGYATPEDAANSFGSGDISTSIETESYTNISDGEVRLSVEYTSKVLVTENNVTLWYNFETLGNAVLKKVTVKKANDGNALSGIVANGGTITEYINNNPTSNVKNTITVAPAQIGTEQKTGSLLIIAEYELNGSHQTIQRKVSYTLTAPYEMEIKCIPAKVPYGINESFDLSITIPDGLGSAMFPLEFNIEAENLSITPDNDNMPVATGVSTIPGKQKSSFWFVKTLKKEEYDALPAANGIKTFLCHFKTNTATSATNIYATNPYFAAYVNDIKPSISGLVAYDVDYLGNYTPQYFEDLAFSVDPIAIGKGKNTTFTFEMTDEPEGYVTVTLINAQPAEGESDLINGRIVDGNIVFDYDATTRSGSFDLITTTDDEAVIVKLEALNFITNSEDAERDWAHFSGGTFAGSLNETPGDKTVTYTFGIPSSGYTSGMVVTVKFDGLAFPGNTVPDRWIAKGNGVYEYRPTSAGNTTITLTSTENGKRTNYVTVSAPGFEAMTSEIKQSNATYALNMYNPTTQSNDWRAQVWYDFEEPLEASQTYILTCWIKASEGLNNVSCSIFLQDSNYDDGTNQDMSQPSISGINGDWKPIRYEFTTPNRRLDRFTFNLGLIRGSIYLDDVSIKKNGTGNELVKNGDFETGSAERWDANGSATVEVVVGGHVSQ